jgi:hypothetical protein
MVIATAIGLLSFCVVVIVARMRFRRLQRRARVAPVRRR